MSLDILEGFIVLLTCTDLDNTGHIVDKYLAVSDMTGVKCLLCRIDDIVYRQLGDDDGSSTLVIE